MKDFRIWINDAGEAEFVVTEVDDYGQEVTFSGKGFLADAELKPEEKTFRTLVDLDTQWQAQTFELNVWLNNIKHVERRVD